MRFYRCTHPVREARVENGLAVPAPIEASTCGALLLLREAAGHALGHGLSGISSFQVVEDEHNIASGGECATCGERTIGRSVVCSECYKAKRRAREAQRHAKRGAYGRR